MKSNKAIEDLKKIGKMFSGLLELAEELEGVSSLDQAAKESAVRYEKAVSEESAAKASMSEAIAELKKSKDSAIQAVKAGKEEAEAIVSEAKLKASSLVSVTYEKIELDKLSAKSEMDAVKADISKLNEKKNELSSSIEEKSKVLSDLNDRISAIKESLR